MKKVLLLLALLIIVSNVWGQTTRISTKTGNWNDPTAWNPSGIPSSADSVVIQSGHTITVNVNAMAKAIRLLGAGSGTRLKINNNVTLTIYGSLSGDASPSSTLIQTEGTGKVRFEGDSRMLFLQSWAANPQGWTLEIALNPNAVGTSASTNIKAGTLIISSGTLQITGDVRPDSGTSETGKLFINSGAKLIVGGNIRRTGTAGAKCNLVQIEGTLEISGSEISANNIVVKSGGVLISKRAEGHTINGNLTYEPGSTLEYAASTSQTTGGELTSNVSNLKINNAQGVTLNSSTTVENLIFTNGKLITTASRTIKVTGSVTGAGAGKFVEGNLVYPVSSTGSKKWEVGQENDYLPVTINFTSLSGSGDVTVSAIDSVSQQPGGPLGDNKVLRRWFRIEKTAGITSFSANITFSYSDADLARQGITDETSLRVFQWDGTQWIELPVTSRDLANNTITVSGVTSFSDFVISSTADNPLPVTIKQFFAKVSGNAVKLFIETATEANGFKGFNIYKGESLDAFNLVASYVSNDNLKAKGSNAFGAIYEWEDKNVVKGRKYYYKLGAVNANGEELLDRVVEVNVEVPSSFALHQNYPNPFNPTTTIEFDIPKETNAKLEIFNLKGEKVAELINRKLEPGRYSVVVEFRDMPSGVYFYKLTTNEFSDVKKMVLMK
ncbi:MAG: T9SS type A sorting domain-containing protein [Candidatus Kryptonium sp.]|nr:T9SS type A sorting domain-containing protein [Candidatus Kryptonium sp.]MCX7762780.1 T9SS type A sorting domain-containing protein [Candidatus Kryptonium sp.]MDW8108036.1 T9SS type A sorting domain-containing protein [Candidatus Kryptonium sp.]